MNDSHSQADIASVTESLYARPDSYKGIHDIVIAGKVIETAEVRCKRFEKETTNPAELSSTYALEAKIEELGERLGFEEIGSYDSIHLLRIFSSTDENLRRTLDNFDPKSIKTIDDYHKFIEKAIGGYANGIIRKQ